jgi:hypothetical protein
LPIHLAAFTTPAAACISTAEELKKKKKRIKENSIAAGCCLSYFCFHASYSMLLLLYGPTEVD